MLLLMMLLLEVRGVLLLLAVMGVPSLPEVPVGPRRQSWVSGQDVLEWVFRIECVYL